MRRSPTTDGLTQDFLPDATRQRLVTRVRGTIVLDLFALLKLQIVPQVATELAVVWLAWGYANRVHLLAWLCFCLFVHHPFELWGFFHTKRYGIPADRIEKWALNFRVLFFINSSMIAYAYYAFGIGSPREDLFLVLSLGLMLVVAQYSRADLKTACVMMAPLFATTVWLHLARGDERDLVIVAFIGITAAASIFMVLQQSRQIFETIYARFVNEELAGVLKTKNAEATRAREDAELANRTKTRFFVSASHDLRQPLHALLLLMGSLRNNVKDERVQPTLNLMDAALGTLKSLFDDLLDIARLESGKTSVTLGAVHIPLLFESLAAEFQPLAVAKGLQLRFRARDVAVMTDGLLLQRILRNFISNAIKYTERGGILIACRVYQESAVIQVFDTGIGIAADQIDSVFDDFYQVPEVSGAPRTRREGVGLGLGIAKRLADLLGHSLLVRSRSSRGSMFGVRVPVSRKLPVTIPLDAAQQTPTASLSGYSIWVVDDDPSVVQAIKMLLSDWGAYVVTATSKSELIEATAVSGLPPDFVIADFQFETEFSGEEILRYLRAHFGEAIPCAIVTGNVTLVPSYVLQLPHTYILAKPVAAGALQSLLCASLPPSAPVAADAAGGDPNVLPVASMQERSSAETAPTVVRCG